MAAKTVNYLVLDTETATLPFVNAMGLTPDQKNAIQQWSRFKLNEQKKELNRLIKAIKSRKK